MMEMKLEKIQRGLGRIISIALALLITVGLCADISAIDGDKASEMAAVERMARGFEDFAESIDLSDLKISPSRLGKLFSDAAKNTPYLFYVDNNLSYTFKKDGYVLSVTPKYNCEKSEAINKIEFCKNEVKKITDIASHGKNELEKALIAHDILCRNYSYDLTLENKDIYAFLKNRVGTCQGYTWTYMAILRELGIECEYVASDTVIHIWLKIKIDGEWYHSDVTWDDPPHGDGEELPVSRRHFLFSDIKADEDGYTDRYGAGEHECSSLKYDTYDYSDLLSACKKRGDADHDGDADLYDLLMMRSNIEYNDENGAICRVCSDINGDFELTEDDVALIREMMLTNSLE